MVGGGHSLRGDAAIEGIGGKLGGCRGVVDGCATGIGCEERTVGDVRNCRSRHSRILSRPLVRRQRRIPRIQPCARVDTLLDRTERDLELHLVPPERLDRQCLGTGTAIPPKWKDDLRCLVRRLERRLVLADLEEFLIRKGGGIPSNQLVGGIVVFNRRGEFAQDLQGSAVKLVNDLVADQHLDIAAEDVADTVGPGPRGTDDIRIRRSGRNLGCVQVREVHHECGARDEFSLDGERDDGGLAEIGEIVKLHAPPLGGPACAAAHDGLVELDRGSPHRRIESFPILETAGHNVEHGGGSGRHLFTL